MRPPRSAPSAGFTLLEVMVSLAILSVALVAIIGINGGAVSAHSYAKQVTVATFLARSKMSDLETEFVKDGFTSEFDQTMDGDFSEEGFANYKWRAEIVKPDLDAANATGMVQELIEGFVGGASERAAEAARESGSAPTPYTDVSSQLSTLQPLIETQVTALTETLEKAVREVRLTVSWADGRNEESLEVVTHMVVLAPAGQPGGEALDPEAEAQVMSTGGTTTGTQQFPNLQNPGVNPLQRGLGPGGTSTNRFQGFQPRTSTGGRK